MFQLLKIIGWLNYFPRARYATDHGMKCTVWNARYEIREKTVTSNTSISNVELDNYESLASKHI